MTITYLDFLEESPFQVLYSIFPHKPQNSIYSFNKNYLSIYIMSVIALDTGDIAVNIIKQTRSPPHFNRRDAIYNKNIGT